MAFETIRCSFCGKPQNEVEKMISSPPERSGTYICNECVRSCAEIMEQDDNPKSQPPEHGRSGRLPLWLVRMLDDWKSD